MSENSSPVNLKRVGIKLVVFAILASLVWVARPLLHPIIYRIAYSPGLLIGLGIPIAIGIVLYFAPPFNYDGESSIHTKAFGFGIVLVGCLVIGLLFGAVAGEFEDRTLAQQAMEGGESIEDFPEINEENPRIAPRQVSDVQTAGSVSYRQYELGPSDIARAEDGSLTWSYPIQPEQFRNQLQGNQQGVLMTDMTQMEDRDMNAYDEQEFVHGQNMLLHRSATWNMLKDDYMVQYRDDPIEFMHDGDAYMAFTKTGHEWHLTPIPHTTPTWEGVTLVHQDGTMEHLSPDEAQQHEVLDGQRLYPLYNSEKKAESLKYRNGIINTLPVAGEFIGVVEPASMPAGAGNSQPFVIDLEGEQMSYVYAMEPAGQDTSGLDEVWFFDAENGEMKYFETDGDTLFGPERAMGIVRSEDSRTDWDTEDSSGEFRVVEPVITVVDDELWWHSKVVPADNTDVVRNSFVNAHNGEVVELYSTEAVIEFISGEEVDEIEDDESVTTEPSPEDDGVEYYIVITGEDGEEVDRIPVEEGQEFDIELVTGDNSNDE